MIVPRDLFFRPMCILEYYAKNNYIIWLYFLFNKIIILNIK